MIVFSCCQGERFLQLPWFGLAHIPSTWDLDLGRSIALPAYTAGVAVVALFLYVAVRKTLKRRHSSLFLVCILLSYTLIGKIILPGPLGRQICALVRPPMLNHRERYVLSRKRLQSWTRRPETSPLYNITPNSLPASRIPYWNASEVESIVQRMDALQESHWTYAASLAKGTGLFLVGRKYHGAKYNGTYLTVEQQDELGAPLWDLLGDVYEELRARTEEYLQAPVSLYPNRGPPTIIMHAPSVIMMHAEIMDVHTDRILPTDYQQEHARHTGKTCHWQKQLSLLVNLGMPPHGARLDYFDANGNQTTIDHVLGHGILVECARPHRLHPHRVPDSTVLRRVMHAFLVPCADGTWQMLGPLGFGGYQPENPL